MKIVRVSATPLNIPVAIDVLGLDKKTSLSLCLTEIETDTGLVGHGMTAITEEEIIAAAVREVAGPALIGEDPMATERLWDKLYWLLSPRGQTGRCRAFGNRHPHHLSRRACHPVPDAKRLHHAGTCGVDGGGTLVRRRGILAGAVD